MQQYFENRQCIKFEDICMWYGLLEINSFMIFVVFQVFSNQGL